MGAPGGAIVCKRGSEIHLFTVIVYFEGVTGPWGDPHYPQGRAATTGYHKLCSPAPALITLNSRNALRKVKRKNPSKKILERKSPITRDLRKAGPSFS